jgi:hypothetical protein
VILDEAGFPWLLGGAALVIRIALHRLWKTRRIPGTYLAMQGVSIIFCTTLLVPLVEFSVYFHENPSDEKVRQLALIVRMLQAGRVLGAIAFTAGIGWALGWTVRRRNAVAAERPIP